MDLNSVFSKDFSAPFTSPLSQSPQYNTGNFDSLLQQASRNKAIQKNKIWDYVAVENDPNFSRNASINSSTLQKATGKLSIVQQMVTVINSQLAISGLINYVPSNVRAMLLNFNSVSDTNVNALATIKQGITFQQITQAFLGDIKLQFGNKTITLNDVAGIANNVITNSQQPNSLKNNGLRSILSLGLQSMLPASMTGFLSDLTYIDNVNNLLNGDPSLTSLFDELMGTQVAGISNMNVSDLVTVTNYDNPNLTLDDPLGLSLQAQFQNELENNYTGQLNKAIDAVCAQMNITADNSAVKQSVENNATENIAKAFSGNLGLPPLTDVINAVVIESNNKTVQAIVLAFDTFTNDIIAQAGLVPVPAGTKPIDYLMNLKRNLQARLDMNKYGTTPDNLVVIEAYLKSVLQDQDLTQAHLEQLNVYMLTLFPDRIEAC